MSKSTKIKLTNTTKIEIVHYKYQRVFYKTTNNIGNIVHYEPLEDNKFGKDIKVKINYLLEDVNRI